MDFAMNGTCVSDPVVSVRNLTKTYRLYDRPIDRLKESLDPFRRPYHRLHHALHDISFELFKGESLGILGKNGAGKSTLLSIIYGLTVPTSGTVEVRGRVGFLNIGGNFNPELSGVENIFLVGAWFGLSRGQIEALLDEIFAFADIGEYVRQPVKTYSSGMYARLGFATNIFLDPDIFIIDEALSVGDARFQQKCLRKIHEFIEQKKTFLFVSHSTEAVKSFCNKVMWIEGGKLLSMGDPDDVIPAYVAAMEHNTEVRLAGTAAKTEIQDEGPRAWQGVENTHRMGNGKVEIQGVSLSLSDGMPVHGTMKGGEDLLFSAILCAKQEVIRPVYNLHFHDSFGRVVFGIHSKFLGLDMDAIAPASKVLLTFGFTLPLLGAGTYSLTLGINEDINGELQVLDCSFDCILVTVLITDKQSEHYRLRLYGTQVGTALLEEKGY